jgi:arylsulfatase A-like enzyme
MNKCFYLLGLLLFSYYAYPQNQHTKPNVVLIISDQHKLKAIGAYGSEHSITPNIDALAKNGIKFTNCYTPAPVCAPARAAMITGMEPYANAAIYHKAPVTMPNGKTKNLGAGYLRKTGYKENLTTISEIFRKNGYVTTALGKMHVHGELQKNIDEEYPQGNDMGFDESLLRYYTHFPGGHYQDEVGEDTYMRYRQFRKYKDVYKKGPMHLNEEYVPTLVKNEEDNFDMVVANKSVEFIEKRAKDQKNFFMHVGFEKPHAPFTTTQKYLDMHNPEDYELPETYDFWYKNGKQPWSPNWIQNGIPKNNPQGAKNVMAAYNACITEMDDMVGRVVQSLKDNDLYENTIIIYTSDHGEHLFDHGLRGKHNMYEAAVNIPFIVSYPKVFQKGKVNRSAISLIDLMPTFAEIIGTKVPEQAQGISLVNKLKKMSVDKDRIVYSEFRGANYKLLGNVRNVPSRMMRKGNYKFIYTHGIIDQLYNLEEDPNELNNLIFNEKYKTIHQQMYFQTLANWHFQKYKPLSLSANKNEITWNDVNHYKNYCLYFSESKDIYKAGLIEEDIKGNKIRVKKNGYYWLIAKPNLIKSSEFYGEDVPVAVKNYTYTLPISKVIHIDN